MWEGERVSACVCMMAYNEQELVYAFSAQICCNYSKGEKKRKEKQIGMAGYTRVFDTLATVAVSLLAN